jgi:hypothetical protein
MSKFHASSLNTTIEGVFSYCTNPWLDSCLSLFPGTFSSYQLAYIPLLENEYYMTHRISFLAFVTCTGTGLNVQL